MPGTDRRSSTSSEDASLPPSRQVLQDGTEFIPTRTAKTGAPKPAANPLQFIKVGPCDLYKAAQEQLKKVEEIKKVEKTVKEDSEDWQSNLDNWKCSRRKRQEHIIDRVVEVKKLELEEHERNRRRGKTLSEMMEERTQKGVGPRKMSLLVYPDDDAADLTDLGISVAEKTEEDEHVTSKSSADEKSDVQSERNGTSNGKKNGVNGHETSSPEPEEYTYERAIQGYKSFAEKSVKAAASRPRVSPPKPGGRIGEKLSELEQVRLRSNSVSDVQLPKVDIHKRRSLFEVVESADTRSPSAERVARDLGGAQIVKARLSSLERRPDISPKPTPRVADEVCLSLKDRLSSLEKQKSPESTSGRRVSSEDLGHISIKERLNSLEKGLKESVNSNSCSDEEIAQKDLLSPAVSDREVSSPLVSSAAISHTVTEESTTNQGFEVTNSNVVEGIVSDKLGCIDRVSAKVEVALTSSDEAQVAVDSVAVSDEETLKENLKESFATYADTVVQMEPDSYPKKCEVNASSSVTTEKTDRSVVSSEVMVERGHSYNDSVEKEKEPCDDSKAENIVSSKNIVSEEVIVEMSCNEAVEKEKEPADVSKPEAKVSLKANYSVCTASEELFEETPLADETVTEKKQNGNETVKKTKEPCSVSKAEMATSSSDELDGEETCELEKHTDSSVKVDLSVDGIEISSHILEVSSEKVEEDVPQAENGKLVEKSRNDTDVQVDINIEYIKTSSDAVEVSNGEDLDEKKSEGGAGETDDKLKECVKDIDITLERVDETIARSLTVNNTKETKASKTHETEKIRDPSTDSETKTTVETTVGSDTATPLEDTILVPGSKNTVIGASEKAVLKEDAPIPDQKKSSPIKVSVTQTHRKVVKKPALRTRKLTPILAAPIAVLSPVKTPGDLEMISEDAPMRERNEDLQDIVEDEDGADGGVPVRPVPKPRHNVKGAETSESGIDMEESSLYTDENIDEVLGEDDVDEEEDDYTRDEEHVPDSARDLEMSRRQLSLSRGRDDSGFSEFEKNSEVNRSGGEVVTRFDHVENDSKGNLNEMTHFGPDSDLNTIELRRQQEAVTRFDELIGLGKQEIPNDFEGELGKGSPGVDLVVSGNNDLVDLLGEREELKKIHSEKVEEEKPKFVDSAPLVDLSQSSKEKEAPSVVPNENVIIAAQMLELSHPTEVISFPLSPLSCLEPPKEKPPPPPVDLSDEEEAEVAESPELLPKTSLRRLDSTKRIKKEIRKKRSDFLGIDGANDDAYLEPEVDVEPPPDMLTLLQEERRLDQQLYRQSLSSEADSAENSEVQTNPVDRLDKALFLDQGLYRQSICSETDSNHETAESRDSGVELDRGHVDDLCWNKESSQPHSRQNSEPYGNPSITSEEDEISKKEREIIEVLEKEEEWRYGKALTAPEDSAIGESLAAKLRQLEQEKMALEWERAEEEGRRMADAERLQAKETLLRQQETSPNINQTTAISQENLRAERERLEKEQMELARVRQELLQRQRPVDRPRQGPIGTNLRYSMPDLQDARPPPPNARPSTAWTRVPSADNLLAPQQMSRTTLQALSAAPRSRIVNGEAWMQPKRKTDAPKSSYNYQHWLIQEAEHRRITEQQQRATQSRRSLPSQPRSPANFSPSCHQPPQQRPHSGYYQPSQPVIPASQPSPYPPKQHVLPPAQSGVHYASQSVPSHIRAASSPNHIQPPVPSHAHSHSLPRPMSPPSHHTVGLPPTPPAPHPHPHNSNKPLPEAVIQTITQRVQNKTSPRRRVEERPSPTKLPTPDSPHLNGEQERMLSVSGKKKCSHCGEELGRGAAMVIESLRLFYHIDCFKCCVCHTQLGDGLMGTDVRVRNNKLHCHNCYSSDDGVKFSCV